MYREEFRVIGIVVLWLRGWDLGKEVVGFN